MSTIPSGLRADIMRKRMEDKNTLQTKGALYVGTGSSSTISATDPLGNVTSQDIYSTAALVIPSGLESGYILTTDNNEPYGLKWGNSVSSFTAASLYTTDISSTTITNEGNIINRGNINNSGTITNGGDIVVGNKPSGTFVELTASTGNVQAKKYNNKELKTLSEISGLWTSDNVIPTANAVNDQIGKAIIAAGNTKINDKQGNFVFYTSSSSSVEGDIIATINGGPDEWAIALTIVGETVNTW